MPKKVPQERVASRVMERIHAENIEMRPQWWFSLSAVSVGVAIACVVLLGVFFVSLSMNRFVIPWSFGIRFAMKHFPWFSAGLSVSLFMLCFALVERYRLAYKWTLTKLLCVLAVIFFCGGFLLYKTRLHTKLSSHYAFSPLYTVEEEPLEILTGTVTSMHTNVSFLFTTVYGQQFRVYLTSETNTFNASLIEGQSLIIAANREGNTLYARAIISLAKTNLPKTK